MKKFMNRKASRIDSLNSEVNRIMLTDNGSPDVQVFRPLLFLPLFLECCKT